MPLTPNEISNKKFSVVRGRGYDRSEVDRFLAFVAEDYSTAIQKIALAAEGRLTTEDDIGSEIAELVRAARTTTTRIKEKAQAEADGMRSQAEADVREQREAAEAEVRARLDKAEKERDDVLQRAVAQATRTIEVSEQQRNKVAALLEERYGELLEHERELRTRIASLEKLVAEMRGQLEPLEQIDLTEADKLFAGTKVNDEGIPDSQFAESSRLDIEDVQRRLRETEGHEKNAQP